MPNLSGPLRQIVAQPASLRAGEAETQATGALGLALWAFLITCVFDPADKVLGIKVWLFVLCWLLALASLAGSRRRVVLPASLLGYVAVFLLIPWVSIVWYMLRDGGELFEGFGLFKGYALITLALLLVMCRVDLLRQMSAVLTALAGMVLVVFISLQVEPGLYFPLHAFGEATGIVLPDNRDYGSEVVLLQVYFVTSPMLAMSIAYYFDRAMAAPERRMKRRYWTLTAINVLGMLLAGTRANILMSLLLPIALWYLYTRHKLLGGLFGLGSVALLLLTFFEELQAFFDPTEISNSIKLAMFKEYAILFSEPVTLLFGQGLGVYHQWEHRGNYYFVTELTYLELIRNFGIFGAAAMMALLLFPIIYASLNKRFPEKAVVLGYGIYLVMCFSNPLLFSSMGILILSAILAAIYIPRAGLHKAPQA